jgi:hypothetical protein
MAQHLNLVRRRITGSVCTVEEQEVQRRIHQSNVRKIAMFLANGGKRKRIFGSDEFGSHLFPQNKYKWEKKRSSARHNRPKSQYYLRKFSSFF